jgi:hypothetical protein
MPFVCRSMGVQERRDLGRQVRFLPTERVEPYLPLVFGEIERVIEIRIDERPTLWIQRRH